MQKYVDQMVADRIQIVPSVVPPKREHGERPIRLVALFFAHRRAPKVIDEQIPDRNVSAKISVLLDGRHVVEHESARQRVPISERTD